MTDQTADILAEVAQPLVARLQARVAELEAEVADQRIERGRARRRWVHETVDMVMRAPERRLIAHLRERLARTQEHCRRLAQEARMWEHGLDGRGRVMTERAERAEAELARLYGSIWCAFCGETYALGATDAAVRAREHARTCELHPLNRAQQELAAAKEGWAHDLSVERRRTERYMQERDAATAREAVLKARIRELEGSREDSAGMTASVIAELATMREALVKIADAPSVGGPARHHEELWLRVKAARAALATPSPAAEALLHVLDAAVSRYELLHAWDVSVYDGKPDTELRDRVGIADTCLDLAVVRWQQARKGEGQGG